MKKNKWDLDKLKDTASKLIYNAEVTALLADKKVKYIQSKEQLASSLGEVMKEAANKTLLMQEKTRKPWISQETLLLVENKRAAKTNRLKSTEAMEEYLALCKKVKKSARKDKRTWIQQQCAEIEQNHTDGKDREAYRLVKQLTGGFKGTTARVVKDAQGTLLTCLLYTSPSPRDRQKSRMPSSA